MERHKSVKLEKKQHHFCQKTPFCVLTTSLTTCGRPLTISNQMRWENSAVLDVQSIGLPKLPRGEEIDLGMAFVVGLLLWRTYMKIWFLEFPSADFLWVLRSADIFVFTGRHCDTTVWLFMIYLTISSPDPRLVLQGMKLKWLRKQRNSARSTMWLPRAARQSIVGCWNC